MLNRTVFFAVLLLALSVSPAFAQFTLVVDANANTVGRVVSVDADPTPSWTLVATQDASGIWIAMRVVQEGFITANFTDFTTVYYTDDACSSTPYLVVLGPRTAFRTRDRLTPLRSSS